MAGGGCNGWAATQRGSVYDQLNAKLDTADLCWRSYSKEDVMETGQTKPNVTVSKSGLFQVTPAEIFRSDIGREAIRKTAELAATRPSPEPSERVSGKP